MPKKKKSVKKPVEETPVNLDVEPLTASDEPVYDVVREGFRKPVSEEPIAQEPLPTDIVKVKVLVGSLHYEGGTYEKGDVFEETRARLKLFDQRDIEVV